MWTMQLLADKLVELKVVEQISDETVRRTLKKNKLKPWQAAQWCLPQVDAPFVWRMCLTCMRNPTSRGSRLSASMNAPANWSLTRKPGRAKRVDCEYARHGVCNAFMLLQPLAGWREVKVTERRTKQDFAHVTRELVDVHFPQAA